MAEYTETPYGVKAILRMNFLAVIALLKEARAIKALDKRKSICLTGIQLFHSSLEDYAIMLQAFRERAVNHRGFHLTIGVEDRGKEGSSFIPRIFKHFQTARQYLDELGLHKVTYERVARFVPISREEFEHKYKDLAEGIRRAGEYQNDTNLTKNKLKHGKPVMESATHHPEKEDVVFLRWTRPSVTSDWILELRYVTASLDQLETAVKNIAQIYIRSLELLWLYMMNYCPQSHEDFARNVMVKCINDCQEGLKGVGLFEEAN